MGTECFTLVRGDTIRVTALDARGAVPDLIRFTTSRGVAKIDLTPVVESGKADLLKSTAGANRIRTTKPDTLIRHTVDIDFLRVDPDMYAMISRMVRVQNAAGDTAGFEDNTRSAVTSFALEVWTRLVGNTCGPVDGFGAGTFGEIPFGDAGGAPTYRYGYTLLPHLRGGRITGFKVENGAVTFRLVGAQTRRVTRWGTGPYDLGDNFERLPSAVSGNHDWRMMLVTSPPPVQHNGEQVTQDRISNGTAANPHPISGAPLVLSGGTAADAGVGVITGGRA